MTYTEKNFFSFPTKMYNGYSMLNTEIQEDKKAELNEGFVEPIEVPYAEAWISLKPENIISWIQAGHREQDIEDLQRGHFPVTIVLVKTAIGTEAYECLWEKKKFEAKLDKWMEGFEARQMENFQRAFQDAVGNPILHENA